MADPTGTIYETCGGKEYALRLTFRGIATLQAKYGNNIAGLLDDTAGDIPAFAPLLDLVSLALQKGSKLSEQDAEDISETMLQEDTEIVGRIVNASFPDKSGKSRGKQKGPKAA